MLTYKTTRRIVPALTAATLALALISQSSLAQQPPPSAPAAAPKSPGTTTKPAVPKAPSADVVSRLQQAPNEQSASEFDVLLQRIQQNPGVAPEQDVLAMLKLGKELGMPYPASLAANQFLGQHPEASGEVLIAAASCAMLGGDLRTAVSRLKNFLRSQPKGVQASEAAAMLYTLLIDYLNADEDAYRLMSERGEQLRDSPAARRFDSWFLEAAHKRKDYSTLARRLAVVFADKLPLEQERLYFWPELDWLTQEMSSALEPQGKSLNEFFPLAALVREDDTRAKRITFYAENVKFETQGQSQDPAIRKMSFEPVVTSAKAYFDTAPTATTLRDIVTVFGGGIRGFDLNRCRRDWPQRSEVIRYAFAKLSAPDRANILTWTVGDQFVANSIADSATWLTIIEANAPWSKGNVLLRALDLDLSTVKPDQISKCAPLLAGVPSRTAATIHSLAAAQGIEAAVDQLLANETWHLSFQDLAALVGNDLPKIHASMTGIDNQQQEKNRQLALSTFFNKYVTKSPIALFDPGSISSGLVLAWRAATAKDADPASFIPALTAIDWVPLPDRKRKEILGGPYSEFKRWSAEIAKNKNTDLGEKIAPIDEAFRKAMEIGDKNPPPPNDLCKKVVDTLRAAVANDSAAFNTAAKNLYAGIHNFETTKAPYGRALIDFLVNAKEVVGSKTLDAAPIQVDILCDLAASFNPDSPNFAINDTFRKVFAARRWNFSSIPDFDRPHAVKINAALSKKGDELLTQGKYSPELFDMIRGTRSGNGWRDDNAGAAFVTRVIEEKNKGNAALKNSPATVDLMYLIRHEYSSLAQKFPTDQSFDDMMVREMKDSRRMDPRYFEIGTDAARKIANTAAEIIGQYKKLPFGYGKDPATLDPASFTTWTRRALTAAPEKRAEFIKTIEASYGTGRFDAFAMGAAFFESDASTASPAKIQEFFDKWKLYCERAAAAPSRINLPSAKGLADIKDPASITDEQLAVLLLSFNNATPPAWPRDSSPDILARLTQNALIARKNWNKLMPIIPSLWKIARYMEAADFSRSLANTAKALMDENQLQLAAAYSLTGQEIGGSRLPEDVRGALLATKAKSLAGMVKAIPVDKADPRYPAYLAQLAYLTGKFDEAWESYRGKEELVLKLFKELDPTFTTWLIEKHTEVAEYIQAENLAKPLIVWMDESPKNFDPEIRASLYVAYAGLSFKRQQYPQARAQYERIAATEDFNGTLAQRNAELKIAEVDRLTGNYDKALDWLDKLAKRDDKYTKTEANYLIALTKYDQDDAKDAMTYIEKVFALEPGHANGRILEGKLFIKLKKYADATGLSIGINLDQRILVPGKPLKITIEDPNLATVGRNNQVQILVWTKSGDKETVTLHPATDAQTKFEGQLISAMAATSPMDAVLQVYGGDLVYYDFAPEFRKKARLAAASQTNSLTVATDGDLYASSGKIIDKEEQAKIELESKLLAAIAERNPNKAAGLQKTELQSVSLSTVRALNQVKPGNKINVRVVDLDQNVSPTEDKVNVRVTASSGDVIDSVELKETGPVSGVFQTAIKTDSSEAAAFASDSDEGKDPCFPISAGEHPPWVALPDNKRPKTYMVDMYDNVPLAKMQIVSDVPGRRLKSFIVQSSLGGSNYEAIASYPSLFEDWDGSPRFTIARHPGTSMTQGGKNDLAHGVQAYLAGDFAAAGAALAYGKHSGFKVAFDENLNGMANKIQIQPQGENSYFVAHFTGGFYLHTRTLHSFELAANANTTNSYAASIDGEFLTAGKFGGGPRLTRQFGKGVHKIDVYVYGQRVSSASFELLIDCEEPPYYKPCPPEMFDPAVKPELATALARKVGQITPTPDGTKFDVLFDERSNARMLRLLLLDFETDAPAISRIHLSNRDNKQILPTSRNLIALRKNDILEIIPGDEISIRYIDPTPIVQAKATHETKLNATFYNANLNATFLDAKEQNNKIVESYITLARFDPGDPITVFINDPDCDISAEPDKIKFTAETFGKKPVELEALETKENSGIFTCRIFPITNESTKASEIPIVPGDDIVLTYFDRENTDPGIPWKRTALIEQVFYQTPEMRVCDVHSFPVPRPVSDPAAKTQQSAPKKPGATSAAKTTTPKTTAPKTGAAKPGDPKAPGAEEAEETYVATRSMIVKRPFIAEYETPAEILINAPLLAEITFPTIAKSAISTTEVFVQTSSGRRKAGLLPPKPDPAADTNTPGATDTAATPAAAAPAADDQPAANNPAENAALQPSTNQTFDLTVPGTIRRRIGPGEIPAFQPPPGYADVRMAITRTDEAAAASNTPMRLQLEARSPLADGLFAASIPIALGDLPEKSLVDEEEELRLKAAAKDGNSYSASPLYVNGEDEIYIGYRYVDDLGVTNWLTKTIKLDGDIFFDIMDRAYQNPIEATYVGETIYFRVMDQLRDISPDKDEVIIKASTTSGIKKDIKILETLKHSGTFKGLAKLIYATPDNPGSNEELPVKYGDTVTLSYSRPDGKTNLVLEVYIYKGADGNITPFTKRFKDPEIAVQTQFTLAESYFELAKRHRKLDQQDLARKEIAQGKKLLEEALRDFPNVEARVQADYLLANLYLEFANDAVNDDAAKQNYLEAVNRFSDIVAKFPDSPYAPKAQYKKGLVYEKLGQVDLAAEEYVKLSYRYPDNELVAETIARLGQYFLTKGTSIMKDAEALEKELDKEKKRMEAYKFFTTSGQVLSRLADRFPAHNLAGKTKVLSGQAYMRAEKYKEAIVSFQWVTKKPEGVEPETIAEGMYWGAEAYMKLSGGKTNSKDAVAGKSLMEAYKLYKGLTWDYPESKWAKFARGRLASKEMSGIEKEQSGMK